MAKKDWMITESELDDDQLKVLFATNNKSCVVAGCAGSGKSVLALIKAQRIQREKGNNYQIIVFTKALCRYMNAGREALSLKNDFYYYEEWRWKKYLKHYNNGMSFMVYERDAHGNKVPNMPKADYTIVDEIQDFTKEEIQQFINSTNKNFFFFGDTAQSIYDGLKKTMPVHAINRLFDYDHEPKNFNLYRNYRLPVPIARTAQYVGIDLEAFDETVYQNKENAIPRIICYRSYEDQLKAIIGIIHKRNLTDVAILFPHNEDIRKAISVFDNNGFDYELKYESPKWICKECGSVYRKDADGNNPIKCTNLNCQEGKLQFNNSESMDNLNFSTNNPKIMTYHSAKGLQFETVFMPNLSPLSNNADRRKSQQKALYVAMTRSYRNLYMMYSGTLPSPVNTIPAELYKTTEEDIVEDI